MANCKDCKGDCTWNFIMPCRVCQLNNNDVTPKRACWCADCGAYICEQHINDPLARVVAAVKEIFTDKPKQEAPQVLISGAEWPEPTENIFKDLPEVSTENASEEKVSEPIKPRRKRINKADKE